VYISGNVIIGENGASVINVIIKKCNLNSIQIKNNTCSGIEVNQNFIRNSSNFGGASVKKISNNVSRVIENINGGNISYNIFIGSFYHGEGYSGYNIGIQSVNAAVVTGNIFTESICFYHGWCYSTHNGVPNCTGSDNYGGGWGEDPVVFDVGLADVFVNWNNGDISPASDFHFKEEYKQEFENRVGIYAGSSFDPDGLAPIPRIISKKVDEQSNAAGKLTINVTVKAK
jgi:hypothetical protein